MALDSFVITGLARELDRDLRDARVDRVTMPARDRVVLSLRSPQAGNCRLLLSAGAGARVHLTGEKYENPETPPMLCMLLRKLLGGGRVVSVTQPDHERLLEMRITSADELGVVTEKRLICEMMGRMTNLILVSEEGVILAALHQVSPESSPRPVQAGMRYRLPPRQDKPSLWELSPPEMEALCRACGDDPSRLCGSMAGLSPLLAREALFQGKTPEGTARFLLTLRETAPRPFLLEKDGEARDFSAFPIAQDPAVTCREEPGFSQLLDGFYREQTRKSDLKTLSAATVRSMTTLRDRLRRKLASQRQELLSAQKREELKRTADLITANLYAIRPGDKSVTLTDYFDPALPQVTVTLDPLLSPQENAQRLFRKYTRLKRAEEALLHQIDLGEQELAYVENVLYTLSAASEPSQLREIREELIQAGYLRSPDKGRRKEKPVSYAPRQFTVDGGLTVFCGRNNRENDELTHRRSAKTDLWFHARGVPGSHAVLVTEGQPPSDRAIEQAAAIAAFYSSAGNQPRVPVDYTQIRRVKKPQGARPGMINYFEFQTALVAPALPEE